MSLHVYTCHCACELHITVCEATSGTKLFDWRQPLDQSTAAGALGLGVVEQFLSLLSNTGQNTVRVFSLNGPNPLLSI